MLELLFLITYSAIAFEEIIRLSDFKLSRNVGPSGEENYIPQSYKKIYLVSFKPEKARKYYSYAIYFHLILTRKKETNFSSLFVLIKRAPTVNSRDLREVEAPWNVWGKYKFDKKYAWNKNEFDKFAKHWHTFQLANLMPNEIKGRDLKMLYNYKEDIYSPKELNPKTKLQFIESRLEKDNTSGLSASPRIKLELMWLELDKIKIFIKFANIRKGAGRVKKIEKDRISQHWIDFFKSIKPNQLPTFYFKEIEEKSPTYPGKGVDFVVDWKPSIIMVDKSTSNLDKKAVPENVNSHAFSEITNTGPKEKNLMEIKHEDKNSNLTKAEEMKLDSNPKSKSSTDKIEIVSLKKCTPKMTSQKDSNLMKQNPSTENKRKFYKSSEKFRRQPPKKDKRVSQKVKYPEVLENKYHNKEGIITFIIILTALFMFIIINILIAYYLKRFRRR